MGDCSGPVLPEHFKILCSVVFCRQNGVVSVVCEIKASVYLIS